MGRTELLSILAEPSARREEEDWLADADLVMDASEQDVEDAVRRLRTTGRPITLAGLVELIGKPQRTSSRLVVAASGNMLAVIGGITDGHYDTTIARQRVSLILPSFRWRPRLDGYVAMAPELTAVRSDVDWADCFHTLRPCGSVRMWHGQVPRRIIRADVRHAVIKAVLPLLSEALQSNAREMGRLVQLLRRLETSPLPEGIEQHLLYVRNRAIHRGAEPSAREASAAAAVATLVNRVASAATLLR